MTKLPELMGIRERNVRRRHHGLAWALAVVVAACALYGLRRWLVAEYPDSRVVIEWGVFTLAMMAALIGTIVAKTMYVEE